MRRTQLSNDELDKVLRLRQIGTNWSKIQHETGIHRRTAKHAYEKWQQSQTPQELKDARKEVAAKALFDHLHSLITLAAFLVTNLRVPPGPSIETNAERFFDGLWQSLLWQDAYAEERYNLGQGYVYAAGAPQCYLIGDSQTKVLQNKLLFRSLQEHTAGGEAPWQALSKWKMARDNCVQLLPELRKETREVVKNFVDQERQSKLLHNLEEADIGDDPVNLMAETVLTAIWGADVEDELEQQTPIQARLFKSGSAIMVRNETFLRLTDERVAEQVTRICNRAYTNLVKGHESRRVKSLRDSVGTMKKAADELCERLNPVTLTPVILRTRCSLCPA